MSGPVGVGIIGAGVISTQYLDTLAGFPDVRVRVIADLAVDRAEARARAYGIPSAGTVDQLLADEGIELVVNLTVPAAHVEVGERILAAGKHLWSEKPYALDRATGAGLLADAERRGLRTGCAPDAFLGAGLQTAARAIADGRIGTPVSALAILQDPGPDAWHPGPEFLFAAGAGPLFDLGPYYLTALVQNLGSVQRVSAVSSTARTTRTIGSGPRAGSRFAVGVPTQHAALLWFAGGATAIVQFSFESEIERTLLEYTGTAGALRSPDPRYFDGESTLYLPGAEDGAVVPAAGSTAARGVGVLELARSIRADVPERATGALALHVLDVMQSIAESAERGEPVAVESTAPHVSPLPTDWDPTAVTL